MAHYKDLRAYYAKNMEFHGDGYALFQPIAAEDMKPPCCGYFDRNGDWNLIANLSVENSTEKSNGYIPLAYVPKRVSDIGIEWQPKTTQGMRQYTTDASGNTPSNLPAGADVHIKYQSKSDFGAVLMTQKPITLTAYNDERLFLRWFEDNRARLYNNYGMELKRYGLWIVTRTFTAPGCSINAWMNSDKQAIVSLRAKAAMLGELGEGLDWSDKLTDKDWCHYKAKGNDGLVVFMDGIEIKPSKWWLQGAEQSLSFRNQRARSASRLIPSPPNIIYEDRSQAAYVTGQLHLSDHINKEKPQVAYIQGDRGRPMFVNNEAQKVMSLHARPGSFYYYDDDIDEQVLRDSGLGNPLSRSLSARRASSCTPSVRSHSLRRETRSISGEPMQGLHGSG